MERTARIQAKATIPLQHDDEDFYPSSDGKPVAETDFHIDDIFYLVTVLKNRYRDIPDVYVAANLLLYFVRGDRTARLAPDVFVVKGVPKRRRKSYLLWKEGKELGTEEPLLDYEEILEESRRLDEELARLRRELESR